MMMVAMEASLYQSCGKQNQFSYVFAPPFAVAEMNLKATNFFLAEHDNAYGVV